MTTEKTFNLTEVEVADALVLDKDAGDLDKVVGDLDNVAGDSTKEELHTGA